MGFPESGDPTLIDSYSDASRELKSPGSSGGGAWCIIAGVFYFIERRWTNNERETYSINVLEYAIMNMATFTFASEARRLGLPVSFVREHTDNSSAEHVAERRRPSTFEIHELTQHRYERLSREGLFSATTRITSIDNDVADWLSRGGQKLMAAIKLAARAGLSVRRLAIEVWVWCLCVWCVRVWCVCGLCVCGVSKHCLQGSAVPSAAWVTLVVHAASEHAWGRGHAARTIVANHVWYGMVLYGFVYQVRET